MDAVITDPALVTLPNDIGKNYGCKLQVDSMLYSGSVTNLQINFTVHVVCPTTGFSFTTPIPDSVYYIGSGLQYTSPWVITEVLACQNNISYTNSGRPGGTSFNSSGFNVSAN